MAGKLLVDLWRGFGPRPAKLGWWDSARQGQYRQGDRSRAERRNEFFGRKPKGNTKGGA